MKISNLSQATVLNDEDEFPVVQGGKTKKVAAKKFFEKQPTDVTVTDDGNMHLMVNGKPVGEGAPLPKVKGALYSIDPLIDLIEEDGYVDYLGQINITQTSYHNKRTQKIPCKEGDVFVYYGNGDSGVPSWFFYKDNGDFTYGYHSLNVGEVEVTIPTDVVSVVFQSYNRSHIDLTLDVYKKNSRIEMLLNHEKEIEGIKETTEKMVTYYHPNLFDKDKVEVGSLASNGTVATENTGYVTSEYIKVSNGETFAISPCRFVCFYDEYKNKVDFMNISPIASKVVSASQDGYIRVTVSATAKDTSMISKGDTLGEYRPASYKRMAEDVNFSVKQEEYISQMSGSNSNQSGNVLYGKKYVAIGDSFTEGDFEHSLTDDYTFTDGLYAGKNKVYPFFIGRRNNMNVVNMALCGSTMANVWDSKIAENEGNTSLVNYYRKMGFSIYRYQEIPTDADYITIKYGINDDTAHRNSPIGTIDDTVNTTFYGAWNIVMQWIITNCPFAKVGIIISNGVTNSGTANYSEAVRNIAKKWGVPYLDEDAGEQVPVLLRTNHPNLLPSVKEAKRQAFSVNTSSISENWHPNEKSHEYESTFVENFLRSL